MKAFSQFINRLDYLSDSSEKVKAFIDFLSQSSDLDKLWTIRILSGKRKSRVISVDQLVEWSQEFSGISPWLFDQSQEVVKDRVETASLILGNAKKETESEELSFWLSLIEELRAQSVEEQKASLKEIWQTLDSQERYLFNKLLVGSFRLVLEDSILIEAIGKCTQQPIHIIAVRFYENWHPHKTSFQQLFIEERIADNDSRFADFPAIQALTNIPKEVHNLDNWLIRLIKPGLRVQLISKNRKWFFWSEDKRFLNPFFPEFEELNDTFEEDVVMEGYLGDISSSESFLEKRLKKAHPNPAFIQNHPVVFYFYDLWEWNGENWLNKNPLQRFEQFMTIFEERSFPDWVEFTPAQNLSSLDELFSIQKNMRQQEIMAISLDSKTENLPNYHLSVLPLTFEAALMYAHRNTRGPGFEAFSFGILKGEELVPIAKLSPELLADDMAEIEAYIKENTLEKFGPVRTVNPFFVFELEAEEVTLSNRHKAGLFLKGVKVIARADNYPKANIARVEDLLQLPEG